MHASPSTPLSRLLRALALVALLVPALVVLPGGASSAAGTFSLVLSPAMTDNTAVRAAQRVTVGGQAPTGALTAARLVGIAADGSEQRQAVQASELGSAGANDSDFLRIENGQVSGRLTLRCVFGGLPDCSPESPAPRSLVRRVLLELVVEGQTGRSNAVRVDLDRPRIRDAWLAAPDAVVVRFTEPVRQPSPQQDAAGDWRVSDPDATVLSVAGPTTGDCVAGYGPGEDASAGATGCTRTLELARPLGEDDAPTVDYVLFDDRFPGRGSYEDFSSASLIYTGTATTEALDRIRPATPRIDRVNSAAPPAGGRVDSNQPNPSLDVSNLVAGHVVVARVTPEGGAPTDGPAVTASGATATVVAPALPRDGGYLLEVVARDPSGNLSNDPARTPGRPDGSPSRLTYVLDTLVPALTGAVTDATTVRVTFSEPVAGTDEPADFRITGPDGRPYPVTRVTAPTDRAVRVLDALGVPVGSTVRYAPAGTSTRYGDAAGNRVPDTTVAVSGVPVPTVTVPAGQIWTSARSTPVRGTTRGATVVSVFRDAGDDGTPDGPALASTSVPAGQSAYEVQVPLTTSDRNDLVVVASDPASGLSSGAAPVPPVVQDETDPTLSLSSPAGGDVFAGGAPLPIRFASCDANAPSGSVRIDFTPDGVTYQLVAPAVGPSCPQGSFDWAAPAVSTTLARIRLTATDLAGNRSVVQSAPFTIDAVPPAYVPTTQDVREVVVRFAEPVSGPVRGSDWTIGGVRASSATSDGTAGMPGSVQGARTIVLRLPPTAAPLGVDDRPVVGYEPPPLLGELLDAAGQGVRERAVEALDGILPSVPTITAPQDGVATGDAQVVVAGAAQPGTTVQVLESGEPRASGPVDGSGAYSLVVPLRPDARNALQVRAVDRNGGAGPSAGVAVVQDSTAPVVTVTAPTGGVRREPGESLTISWSATDRQLAPAPVTLLYSDDGGASFVRIVGEQPASGSFTWTLPSRTTPNALVRVAAVDAVGRVGSTNSGRFGVGLAASPEPSAAASPSASPSAAPVRTTAGTFTALLPARVTDTRTGVGGRRAALGAGETARIQLTGVGGVPSSGVAAVVVNLTAVQPTAAGHLTVWPTGGSAPTVSSVNFPAGRTVANLATLPLGPDGSVQVRNAAGEVHLAVDVFGWYASSQGTEGSAFAAVAPQRLLDTREGTGAPRRALQSSGVLDLQVTGRGGVPAGGVTAVVLNLTAVAPSRATHLVAWPTGASQPGSSNLNVPAGATVSNLVTVPVGRDGKVSVSVASGSVQVLADVFGWYGAEATDVLVPVGPRRLLDTRAGSPPPGRVGAGRSVTLQVAGNGALPEGVTAAVLNLAVVQPTAATHLTAFPAGGPVPGSSNVNAAARLTSAGLAVVRTSDSGAVQLRNAAGEVHLVADVFAYFRRR